MKVRGFSYVMNYNLFEGYTAKFPLMISLILLAALEYFARNLFEVLLSSAGLFSEFI